MYNEFERTRMVAANHIVLPKVVTAIIQKNVIGGWTCFIRVRMASNLGTIINYHNIRVGNKQ